MVKCSEGFTRVLPVSMAALVKVGEEEEII